MEPSLKFWVKNTFPTSGPKDSHTIFCLERGAMVLAALRLWMGFGPGYREKVGEESVHKD